MTDKYTNKKDKKKLQKYTLFKGKNIKKNSSVNKGGAEGTVGGAEGTVGGAEGTVGGAKLTVGGGVDRRRSNYTGQKDSLNGL